MLEGLAPEGTTDEANATAPPDEPTDESLGIRGLRG
jgi:hypothetical protein